MTPHIMKVVDVVTNTTTYPLASECAKCHQPMIIPEPYVSWYRRVLDNDVSVIKLSCHKCGGPELDPHMHFAKSWVTGVVTEQKQTTPPVVVDSIEHHSWPTFYDDTYDVGFRSYHYKRSFSVALQALRAFITKENTNGQFGPVEQSKDN